jgi:hypothetical protein
VLTNFDLHQKLFGYSNEHEVDGWEVWHVWKRKEMHIAFLWANQMEVVHLTDIGVDGKSILR